MKILGLIGFGYNPAAALIVDGALVAHCEEERLTRFKGSHFMFPGRSAAWCLQRAGCGLADIDTIAWAWDQPAYRVRMPLFFAKRFFSQLGASGSGHVLSVAEHLLNQHPSVIRPKIVEGLRMAGLGGPIPPIEFLPHHLCHAASSYYLSGFEQANVLVLDGSGETCTSSIYSGQGDQLRVVDQLEIPNSLGWFYAAFTEYLGFIPYRDEGKVMGLAAYGTRQPELLDKISQVISVTTDSYQVDPSFTLLGPHTEGKHYSDQLVALFGPPRRYGEPLRDHDKEIAWACQTKLEEAAVALVRRALARHPSPNLCLAGGVALNCKMNGQLRALDAIDQIFVQPSASDAGSALGAALVLSQQAGELERTALTHVFYGPAHDNDAIRRALDTAGVSYETPADLPRVVGQAIARDEIVAVYDGAMEFGARALGHRSILANPLNPKTKDRVNARVKFRETWRPFCPSMLEEEASRYFAPTDSAPFMIVAYWMNPEQREKLPSVVHVDGSIRPQTVRREVAPFFWQCIESFRQETGEGIVLNTSFNVRGQPIINSPTEALACFFSTGLDGMAIGDFWVRKRHGSP